VIKAHSIDAFPRKNKGLRRKRRSAPRSEILNVKVIIQETYHTDEK